MKYFKFLFALLFTIGAQFSLQATHITGGDITYENVGQDTFLIRLRLFRDCSGVSAPSSASVSFSSSCGNSLVTNLPFQSSSEISQICALQLSNTTCGGGTWPGMEEHVYSGLVVLSPPCSSWTMSWQSCCRPNTISNLTNPGSLSTYISASLNSIVSATNSSPVFNSPGAPIVFLNQSAQFNFGAIDPDGDSLEYHFAPGRESASLLTPYVFPYTFFSPLPATNAILDSQSGQLNFTPTLTGSYLLGVRVSEYDRLTGVFKGAVQRDMVITVSTGGSMKQPNFSATGLVNNGDGSFVNGTLNMCAGDSLDIDITAWDSNSTDVLSLTHDIYDVLDSNVIVTTSGSNPMIINIKWLVPLGRLGTDFFRLVVKDNGCPILGQATKSIKIHFNQRFYAGANHNICAGDSVQMQAIGGTNIVWSVINGPALNTNSSSSGYNATCSTCANPKMFPSANTTYLVVSNISGSCGNTDTVAVNIGPNFSINATPDTTICSGASIPLSSSVVPASGNYEYLWTPGSSLNLDTIANPMASPLGNIQYKLVVANGACVQEETVDVSISGYFPGGNYVTGDTIICSGGSTQLSGHLGSFPPIASCGFATDVYGKANLKVVGNSSLTHTSTLQAEIYERNSMGSRHQILFTAAELQALGFSKGKISDIAFEIVSNVNQTSFTDLTVKMGCTSSSFLSNWETGLTQVFYSSSHIPSAGWDQLIFPTPYDWDGNSNIVIEICHSKGFALGSMTVRSYYTNVGAPRCIFEHSSLSNVCYGTGITPTSSNARPNVRFGYYYGIDSNDYVYSWTPAGTVGTPSNRITNVSPVFNTNYQLVISNVGGGCSDTINTNVNVNSSQFDAGFSYDSLVCLNSGIQTLVPFKPGGVFTGTGISASGVFDPATAGVGTWPINYNIPTPALCSNDSTVMITVQGLPDASFIEPEICTGTSSLQLAATTSGGVWSGMQILDSTLGTFDPVGLPAGPYEVVYTLNSPCYSSDTGFVTLIEPYQFVLSQNAVSLCQGDRINLTQYVQFSSAPNQGSNPYVSFSDPNSIVQASGVFDATNVAPGNYTIDIIVSDEVGACNSSNSITVTVDEIDNAEIIEEPSYCISQSTAQIFVQPWLFGAGVSFTQRPLGSLGQADSLNIVPFGQNGEFVPSDKGLGSWEIEISYTNVNGCTGTTLDTIHVLEAPQTNVTNTGLELYATAGAGYIYQWLDCNNGNVPIPGATSSTYIPGIKGRFAVEIKAGNCVATSNCFETWPVSISEMENMEGVLVYPNPVKEFVNIEIPKKESVIIQVLDNMGKVVHTLETSKNHNTISLEECAPGIYAIKIKGENIQFSKKIIKP